MDDDDDDEWHFSSARKCRKAFPISENKIPRLIFWFTRQRNDKHPTWRCSEKLNYGAYCPGTIRNSRLEKCGPTHPSSYAISDNQTIQEQTVSAVICFLT